jgi:GntR family transcriptional regulator
MARTIAQAENTNASISIALDHSSGIPVYRQIIRQIENAVISGRMTEGDRLPTIRALAVELKINPNTIAKAYSELEIRGILSTQVGSGTFISNEKHNLKENVRENKIKALLERFSREMTELGLSKNEIIEKLSDKLEEK